MFIEKRACNACHRENLAVANNKNKEKEGNENDESMVQENFYKLF